MRIENRRVVARTQVGKILIEDNEKGLLLTDPYLNLVESLGYEDYQLLDFAPSGKIVVLSSKEWLIASNTNKTMLVVIDIENKKELYRTKQFLAYRAVIDKSSCYFLLEYYNGLCSIDISSGEIIFKKQKIDRKLYNADSDLNSNRVYIPTGRSSLSVFDFNEQTLSEIHLEKVGGTTWVQFAKSHSHILVSDKKNKISCFYHDNFSKPIWSTDFSKFENDNRIWCYPILTTHSDLGCVQGFMPVGNQTGYSAGTLYIFNVLTGEIIDRHDYSNINQKIITDYNADKILVDDLTAFSLRTKTFSNTPMSKMLKV